MADNLAVPSEIDSFVDADFYRSRLSELFVCFRSLVVGLRSMRNDSGSNQYVE